MADKQEFIRAAQEDEYAELELSTGDTLVTDWEGNGMFNPYVVLTGEHGDAHPTDILDAVADAVAEAIDIRMSGISYDPGNDVIVPHVEGVPDR